MFRDGLLFSEVSNHDSARLLAVFTNCGTDLAFDDNLNREAFPAPFPKPVGRAFEITG
jgi:hypothetical protein